MEGIRITGQDLFTEEAVSSARDKVHSLIVSKGLKPESRHIQDTQISAEDRSQNIIQASSLLNSIEVRFRPYRGGTKIEVDHGITPLGLILGVLGLLIIILGIVIFLFWFLKYNETKDDLHRTFPGYLPPAQTQYREERTSPTQGEKTGSLSSVEETGDQITPDDEMDKDLSGSIGSNDSHDGRN